jgi:hypothetical protein
MKFATPEELQVPMLQKETMLAQYHHLLNNVDRRIKVAQDRQDYRLVQLLDEERNFILRHI